MPGRIPVSALLLYTFSIFPVPGSPALAQSVPIEARGVETQVNSATAGGQRNPAVGMSGDGAFVVVWETDGDPSIRGRRFAADGSPVAGELDLNFGPGSVEPALAVGSEGSFVVAYRAPAPVAGYLIAGQRFDSAGQTVGSFVANSQTITASESAAVAMAPDGSFVVAWDNAVSGIGYDGRSVWARRFDSVGNPLDDEFRVNTYTTGDQIDPAVGVDDAGNFVVVWESDPVVPLGFERRVFGQRYDSSGVVLGGELEIDSLAVDGIDPALDVAGDGSFVVAWSGEGIYASRHIRARRFGSDGVPIEDAFQIGNVTINSAVAPSVAWGGGGGFLAVWDQVGSFTGPDEGRTIQGRSTGPDGGSDSPFFQANTYTTGDQVAPGVAADGTGRFVVVWQSDGSAGPDTDSTSIQAQRFVAGLFADGFESGDTSAW